MLGFYTPLLILQAFCLYHAYRNNAEQRWYWLIIFIPAIGCAIYLYNNFYSRRTIQNLSEGVKEVINTNYRIEQLEKALRFSDNATNKLNLADAYMHYGRFKDAMSLYKECLGGFMGDDPTIKMKLIEAAFYAQDYTTAVSYGETLEQDSQFKKSDARIAYAWSLHHSGLSEKAGVVFEDMDRPFTNYKQRLAYCTYLKESNKVEALRNLLSELLGEFEHMKSHERRMHRDSIRQIEDFARAFKG